MNRLIVAFIALTASIVPFAASAEEPWTIAQRSGQVWVMSGGVELASTVREVGDGAVVWTGRSGRAMLVRGNDRMIVGPRTQITIRTSSAAPGTAIVQKVGELFLDVERRGQPHFSVHTPFLAALVKGTAFRVLVDGSGARVDVQEGVVAVTNAATGEVVDVPAGETAGVRRGGRLYRGEPSASGTGTRGPTGSGGTAGGGGLGGAVGGIGDAAGGAVGGVSDAVDSVGDAVDDATDAVTDAVEDVADAVDDAVGGIGGLLN